MFINKTTLKKRIDSKQLKNITEKCDFIGLFCLQNNSVINDLILKKKLKNEGFYFKLIKNSVIFKNLFKSIPEMKGVLSGSLIICYNKDHSTSLDFSNLKEVFNIMRKEKNSFFLGASYKGVLFNPLFEKKILSLKDIESVKIEYIMLIYNILNNINKNISISKNTLSYLLRNKINKKK